MRRTVPALWLVVAAAAMANAAPAPEGGSGQLSVFLDAHGRRAGRTVLEVVEIAALPENGDPVPLAPDLERLDPRALRGRQVPLAAGPLPAGRYRGLILRLGEEEIRLSLGFRISPEDSSTLIVRWAVEQTRAGEGGPTGAAFSLEAAPQALRRLTLYVVDERAEQVVAVNRDTDRVFATIRVGTRPRGLTVAPDGQRAYVANSGDDSLSVLDTATHRVLDTIPLKPGCEPEDAEFAGAGRRLAISCPGLSSVAVIDALSNAYLGDVGLSRAPTRLAAAADGTTVYALVPEGNEVVALDVARVAEIGRALAEAAPHDLAVDASGGQVYVTHPDAPIVTLISGDLRSVDRLQVGIPSLGAALDPDGRRLYLSAAEPGGVLMVGPRLGTIIRRWNTPVARFVALDPDGRKLYASGGSAGTLIVVDRIAGRMIAETRVGRSAGDLAVVP